MRESTILGIAIRARWLGFGAIDQQNRLLECGMIFYQRRSVSQLKSAKRRLESTISRLSPSRVALLRAELTANDEVSSVRSLVRALRGAVSLGSISMVSVHRDEVRKAFGEGKPKSKDEIASALVGLFPELAWRLPRKRQIWSKEDFRMAMFDAVAAAVACHRSEVADPSATTSP
jgi:hypothetical protein